MSNNASFPAGRIATKLAEAFFIGELAFMKDNAGGVSGFIASNGRTKGILFERY